MEKLGSESDPCPCERGQMSPESSGPVHDNEILDLLLTDPQAIVDGKINPIVFSGALRNGLSTIRTGAPVEEYKTVLNELNKRSKEANGVRYFDSVLRFPAGMVREKDGRRLLCVYDTALPNQPNHVDLMSPNPSAFPDKNSQKKFQRILKDLLAHCIVDGRELHGGQLTSYMRKR
jgi:hypothetical protein